MKKPQHLLGLFHIQSTMFYYLVIPANVQHCTWLGEPASAACGGSRAAGERPGAVSADAQHLLGLFHIQSVMIYYLAIPANVQRCTWLGEAWAASCGTEACRARWAKQAGEASGIARSACATMRVPRVAEKPMPNARESRTRLLQSST